MQDKNGFRLNEGMIVHVLNHPEIAEGENWVVHDFIEAGIFVFIILRNCMTNEIRIFDSPDIERI